MPQSSHASPLNLNNLEYMLYRIFFVLLALLALTDGYIYARFLHRIKRHRLVKQLFWLPSILLAIALVCLTYSDNFSPRNSHLIGIYLLVYMALTIPKGLFCLFMLVGRLFRLFSRRMESVMFYSGLLVGFLSMAMVIYGATEGWRHFQVKEVTFKSKDLPPAFDGYRITQISDLHIGTIAGYPKEIRRMVDLINAQQSDLIVFTGDLINHKANELDSVEHILAGLHAPDGVYSVLGNHDYSTYIHWATPEAREENLKELKQRQARMGWQLLNNDHVTIKRDSCEIALVGVENDGEPPFPQLGDLPKATQGTEGLFKVLLSHDPTHWRREVLPESDIQLMLAGHTHAMQFILCGYTPASWFYPENRGMYMENDRGLYVNIGLGEVMLPFRFGAWPEITVITLQCK